jgi:hypothetical protein
MRSWYLPGVLLIACAPRSSPDGSREKPGLGPKEVVPTAALAPGACDDVPLYTLEDLATGKGAGERIAVDLVPRPGVACTDLWCPNSECCNGCGGSYGAHLAQPELELRLEGFAGCTGMDCNLHCEPFGRAPTTRYRFVGTNTFTPAGTNAVYREVAFSVERFCRL